MFKVAVVFGTRPEAIKMVPVIRELARHPDQINYRVCLTAQHREMVDQVLEYFSVIPDVDMDLMTPNQDLFDLSVRLMRGLSTFLTEYRPDYVLVHGDTTTTLMASLAAYYLKVRIGHVEAGLRTGDPQNPFPEEMNRKICDTLADIHFAPTERSRQNLEAEGVNPKLIHLTGNTAIDALHLALEKEQSTKHTTAFPAGKRGILVTAHRREKFGEGISDICSAIRTLALARDDIHVLFPVHPNPNIRKPVNAILGGLSNVELCAPADYPEFVRMMQDAYLILTDSGGIQEEAPALGKPVLVMRDCTERQEAIEAGTVKMVGTEPENIVAGAEQLLDDQKAYQQMARAVNPYGDGHAARRIVAHLLNDLNNKNPLSEVPEFLRQQI
ncbi:MAG: UDP-N-acetylglucosamine 2-epimerase (non-hydrolyzing) [Gemmatimonadales bacterium]|nr:UDP-N-acetylglucosamine 2-epimerase (non-hydrolyzing) [Gemmatimonadales bacterium]